MPQSRDYFAELYIAGILGDCGWSAYFPKRDVGFDFIITKQVESGVVVRPVQVKGKYPEEQKEDNTIYGYIGALSQVHPEMVLAIPFFPTDRLGVALLCTAYVPFYRIRIAHRRLAAMPASRLFGVEQFRHRAGPIAVSLISRASVRWKTWTGR